MLSLKSHLLLTSLVIVILAIPCQGQESNSKFEPCPLVIKDENLEEAADIQYKTALQKNNPELSFKMAKTMKGEYKLRKEYFIEMLHDGDLIVSGELYNYVQSLLDKITASVNIPNKKVFIVRDYSPNAFNMGDDNIFIHLGLIYYSNSEDELAFIIAHELGHNELGHYDESVLHYAELEHNDSINKRISKIKKSEYGGVSAINKLMIPLLIADKVSSRKDEYAADEYALNSAIEIGYDLTKVIEIYDIFENYGTQVDTIFFDF
jgi:predicted Zn-dependent protease